MGHVYGQISAWLALGGVVKATQNGVKGLRSNLALLNGLPLFFADPTDSLLIVHRRALGQ